MVAAQSSPASDDPAVTQARRTIEESNAKLTRYRAALDAGADPHVVTAWIAQAQAEKIAAERRLRQANEDQGRQLTRDEISEMINSLGDIAVALSAAEAAEKAELYRQLNLRLAYQPATNTVRVAVKIDSSYREVMDRVRGGT
ncbi:hypothetical protein I6A60_36935 [Frankia sp. AgB1.9]|uniref:hypothetical protein n=1 Tax=unclassified Frankia TaxID=2632575 RepID=UPI00193372EF|nr:MULTISPECIES: hypothetical protein [unclassified Frankia]MBL7491388.1 hypothetical protein [Frankia sp. AgW1.1]MBL7553395.1 hypothetical protein [Frankia sp. AgB1.9]MBL7617858.1 hypothetical protein [Frankia sp. AgB1.8]